VAAAGWSSPNGPAGGVDSPIIRASQEAGLPVETQAIGKVFPPVVYAVGREKIREYARAVGETDPLYLDPAAARAAGHADVVAPPMFAVVYALPAIMPALFDPEIAINFAMLVHGAQEFAWGPLVVAGDEITTTVTLKDINERLGNAFYVFESVAQNQRGEQVSLGTWTNIVRGTA
jgi:acyl dehydratase